MLQVWVSRLCDSLSFRVSVTTLVFRLGEKFSFRVCVTNLVPASVSTLVSGPRDKSVTSLVFPVCVTNLVFQSV